MLAITTTDKLILFYKDGTSFNVYRGLLSNYNIGVDRINFYKAGQDSHLVMELWANGITINGIEVTRDNANEVLQILGSQCNSVGSVNGRTGSVVLGLDSVASAEAATLLSLLSAKLPMMVKPLHWDRQA